MVAVERVKRYILQVIQRATGRLLNRRSRVTTRLLYESGAGFVLGREGSRRETFVPVGLVEVDAFFAIYRRACTLRKRRNAYKTNDQHTTTKILPRQYKQSGHGSRGLQQLCIF